MNIIIKPMQIVINLIFILLFCVTTIHVKAQQSKVDSIIPLLEKSKTKNGIDSVSFNSAMKLLGNTVLADAQIAQIENAGIIFKKGNDEDICYLIKYNILLSLTESDKSKAIDYGRLNLKELENSKSPNSEILKSAFFRQLRLPYRNSSRLPEGLQFCTETLNRLKRNNDSAGMADCYYVLAGFYRTTGLIDQAIYNMKKSVSYLDSSKANDQHFFKLRKNIGRDSWRNNTAVVGDYYLLKGDYAESIKYTRIALKLAITESKANGKKQKDISKLFGIRNLALAKLLSNQLDSVEYFLNIGEKSIIDPPNYPGLAVTLQIRALYKIKTGALNEADSLLQRCWKLIDQQKIGVNTPVGIVAPDYYLALIRIKQNRNPEAIELLKKDIIRLKNVRPDILRDYKMLADLYEKTGDKQKAVEAYKSFVNLQDSVVSDQNKYRTLSFETEQQMNEKELSISKLENENKISSLSRNFSIGIAVLLLLLAGGVYHRFRSKKKANFILENTLDNLKSTQSQLIQSEKMASLGELTAGIAHEIQNPLNFVNNFSEINTELIEEMKQEIDKGNLPEVKILAHDIAENELKINQHGKRADAIVKGMLQHSRKSSGIKEPTDINALADEYLRLAYHGLRAKDKSFNSNMSSDFDANIGKVNIIPQDIGRVILNLITNAFYAVTEKKNLNIEGYEPLVSISTHKKGNKVEIKVSDNGNGIPQKVIDKIFQPFFTTKPSGQGTGLGLSMSYDVITKGHGGELIVETKEGEGTVFTILLTI